MKNPNVSNLLIKIEIHKDDNYSLITFDGDLDKLGLESVRKQIDELVEKLDTKYMVFDFTDLNFINSESIGYLLTIQYGLIKRDKLVAVVKASDRVKDVLQVIGVNEMVGIYDNMKAFLDAIK